MIKFDIACLSFYLKKDKQMKPYLKINDAETRQKLHLYSTDKRHLETKIMKTVSDFQDCLTLKIRSNL